MNIAMIFPLRVGPFGRLMPAKLLARMYRKAEPNRHATKKGPGRKPLLRNQPRRDWSVQP